MLEPQNILVKLLKDIASGVQPSLPKKPSMFDYFLERDFRDRIQPVIMKKWYNLTHSRNNPPNEFCVKTAIEMFESLSEADRTNIKTTVNREYASALARYAADMKKIYNVSSPTREEYIKSLPDVLHPVMSALEAMTGLKLITWAGGTIQGSTGMMNITTPSPSYDERQANSITFPDSEWGNFKSATIKQWINDVETKFLDDCITSSSSLYHSLSAGLNSSFRETHGTIQSSKRKAPADSLSEQSSSKKIRLIPQVPSFPETSTVGPIEDSRAEQSSLTKDRMFNSMARKQSETLALAIKSVPMSAKWLLQGLIGIVEVDLGPIYEDLLILFIQYESLRGFVHRWEKSRFPIATTGCRPAEVGRWIQNGRWSKGRDFKINDVDGFGKRWWNWWKVLQPAWRVFDDSGPRREVPRSGEDWECLQVRGANGILLVVSTLYCWGRVLKENGGSKSNREDWTAAVRDCTWVLERLVITGGGEVGVNRDEEQD